MLTRYEQPLSFKSCEQKLTNIYLDRRQCLPRLFRKQVWRVLWLCPYDQPHFLSTHNRIHETTTQDQRSGQWTKIYTDSSNTMGTKGTHRRRFGTRDHLLGSRQHTRHCKRGSSHRRCLPIPATRARREGNRIATTKARMGQIFPGRLDLDKQTTLLPHPWLAQPLEREQRDQNRARRYRDRT